tara:strand:+ start:825 stop:1442 length:618 start_codon:yes stop_codon:yes gene_type:complete
VNTEIMKLTKNAYDKIIDKHTLLSESKTPSAYVEQKQGFDYVDEAYMRHMLNKNFPIWSWEIKNYELLGDKWIIVQGRLTIEESGIVRYFDAVASHRIATNRQTGDYVDIGNDMKSANSDCFKVAVNRLCNIADDVYRKQVKDLTLDSKDISILDDKCKQLSELGQDAVANKVQESIDDGKINKSNFNSSCMKLDSIIEKHKKEK